MHIVLFLIFGLVIGLLARAIMPGRQAMNIPMTLVLGVVGSYLGGFLVALVTKKRVTDFNTAGLIGSLIGALLVLFIYERVVASRRAKAGR